MKRLVRPPQGWPWEQPGYTFSISWPPGYETARRDEAATSAARQAAGGARGGEGLARAQLTDDMRAGQLGAITTGRGTLPGIARRSQQDIDKNEQTRRGGL